MLRLILLLLLIFKASVTVGDILLAPGEIISLAPFPRDYSMWKDAKSAAAPDRVIRWDGSSYPLYYHPERFIAIYESSSIQIGNTWQQNFITLDELGMATIWIEDRKVESIPDVQSVISPSFNNVIALIRKNGDLEVNSYFTGIRNAIQGALFGTNYLVLLKDGTLTNLGPQKVPPLTKVKKIAAGYAHAVALRENGSVFGWLGSGYTNSQEIAQALPSVLYTNVVDVEIFGAYTALLFTDGEVKFLGPDAPSVGRVQGVGQLKKNNNELLLIGGDPRAGIPIITGAPSSRMIFNTAPFGLKVSVSVSRPLFYQWFKDKEPIPGANSEKLLLRHDQKQPSVAGEYFMIASNSWGAATSSVAKVVVKSADEFKPDFIVDSSADSGVGTLRSVLEHINSLPNPPFVSIYIRSQGSIHLLSPLPAISSKVTIQGDGPECIRISGTGILPIFQVNKKGTLTLDGVTLADGRGDLLGTALRSDGEAVLRNCKLAENDSAIFSSGKLTLVNCQFLRNRFLDLPIGPSANNWWEIEYGAMGASIFASNSVVVIDSSFFTQNGRSLSSNSSSRRTRMGGVLAGINSSIAINNSTFTENSASGSKGGNGGESSGAVMIAEVGGFGLGGALYLTNCNFGVTNCTFTQNLALGGDGGDYPFGTLYAGGGKALGGAVYAIKGQASIIHCTFVENKAQGGNGPHLGEGNGHSIYLTEVSAGSVNNNLLGGGNPNLGLLLFPAELASGNLANPPGGVKPLHLNGGVTPTHLLPWNSPAINTASKISSVSFDQRQLPRPSMIEPDFGAVEMQFVAPVITISPSDQKVLLGQFIEFTLEVEGPPPTEIAWYKDGELIMRGASNRLTIEKASSSDGGVYEVKAVNRFGESEFKRFKIEVDPSPAVIIQEGSRFVEEGKNVFLVAVAYGRQPLTYRWYKGGNQIPMATGSQLEIKAISAPYAGEYLVEIKDPTGAVAVAQATIKIWPKLRVEHGQDDSAGSLRFAMLEAASRPADITSHIIFDRPLNILLESTLPTVKGKLHISGITPNETILQPKGKFRLFTLATGSNLHLENLRLEKGSPELNSHGGAILNLGTLSISNCHFSMNQTTGGFGGAIYSSGLLTVVNSSFTSNRASGQSSSLGGAGAGLGGAIFIENGSAKLVNSLIYSNTAAGGKIISDFLLIHGGGPQGGFPGGTEYRTYKKPAPGGFGSGGGFGSSSVQYDWMGATAMAFGGQGGAGGFGGGGGAGGPSYNPYGTFDYAPGGLGGYAGGKGGIMGGAGAGLGGGIFVKTGVVEVLNASVLGNVGLGGTVIGTTNSQPGQGIGGGIFVMEGSTLTIKNSVLAYNQADQALDIVTNVHSRGFNFFQNPPPGLMQGPFDLFESNPGLDLQLSLINGLPVMFPREDSVLVDRGDSEVLFDHLGRSRSVDVAEHSNFGAGNLSDIGSIELDTQLVISYVNKTPSGLKIGFFSRHQSTYNIHIAITLSGPWTVARNIVSDAQGWIQFEINAEQQVAFIRVQRN